MRYKLTVLAVAALLAVGTGSIAAATLDSPTTDESSEAELPDNYTVDVTDPDDELNETAVNRAIETAWANDEVRSYFSDGAPVHFDVWVSQLDDPSVFVNVAPIDEPDKTRVTAEISPTQQSVTTVKEPIKLNASNAIAINASDYEVQNVDSRDDADSENATRLTADQSVRIQVNESSITTDGDGIATVSVERGVENNATLLSEDGTHIDFSPANRTVTVGENGE